ncbi:MAG: PilZ domain-containing protein [Acetobacteraceae bacterium]|nr:PilZ domain-containing protein [Acetobacteraceae bacterium]MDI3308255.1 PilZ domain-containing protein [Acetobacteraceae bacterium]
MSTHLRTWTERRRADRSHMIRAGRITSGDRTLDCIVLNTSVTGAKVYLPAATDIVGRVMLTLPDGRIRQARIRWREGEQIGLEFLD